MKWIVLAVFLIFSFFSSHIFSETESIDPTRDAVLEADSLLFDNEKRFLVANNNVKLLYRDFKVMTSELIMDVDKNTVWGTKETTLIKGEDELKTTGFYLDLTTEEVRVFDLDIVMDPPEKKGYIHVTIDQLKDIKNVKHGKNLVITSCDAPVLHHFLNAKRFIYTPDKRIVLKDVIFYNEFLGWPIIMWLPYYSYELGKRKIIWNFPTIGKKDTKGWGWFIQNTIDYDYLDKDRDSSVFVDWYQSKEGRSGDFGYGVRHHYERYGHKGYLYFYNYNYKNTSKDLLTLEPKHNRIIQFHNEYSPNDFIKIVGRYENTDIEERIIGTGSQKEKLKELKFFYDKNGYYHDLYLKQKEDVVTKIDNLDSGYVFKVNNQERFSVRSNRIRYSSQERIENNLTARYNMPLPNDMNFSMDALFKEQDKLNDFYIADGRLEIKGNLHKKLSENLDLKIIFAKLIDTDGERVISDIKNNNYLHKLPEAIITHTKRVLNNKITLKTVGTIARYQEKRYVSAIQNVRVFPASDVFSIAPNTYGIQEFVNINVGSLPLKQNIALGFDLSQFIFKVPNYGLFEGDAMYSISTRLSHGITWGVIKIDSRYDLTLVSEKNNSPFIELNKDQSKRNELSEVIYLFFKDVNKYSWQHSLGYNWVTDKWKTYTTKLIFNPITAFNLSIQTGKNINSGLTESEKNTRYQPLQVNFKTKYKDLLDLNYNISYDLNKWINDSMTAIRNSSIMVSLNLGKRLEYRWRINLQLDYNLEDQEGKFDVTRYDFSTISIQKKEHKRSIDFSYNMKTKEISFKYMLDIFPSDPLHVRRENGTWRLEGRFGKQAENRFSN